MFVISVYALFFILIIDILKVKLKQFVTDDDELFLENG